LSGGTEKSFDNNRNFRIFSVSQLIFVVEYLFYHLKAENYEKVYVLIGKFVCMEFECMGGK
jgi:hypothetical protein